MIRKLIIVLFLLSFTQLTYGYDVNSIDWSKSKKNYCARNVKTALGLNISGDAYLYKKYIDSSEPTIGAIGIIDRYTKDFQSKGTMGYKYGHVGIIYEINAENNTITIYDGIYRLTLKKDIFLGYISVSKIDDLKSN